LEKKREKKSINCYRGDFYKPGFPGTIKLGGDRHVLLHSPQYNGLLWSTAVHDPVEFTLVHGPGWSTMCCGPLFTLVHGLLQYTVHYSPLQASRSSPQYIPVHSLLQFTASQVHSPLQSNSLSTPHSLAVHSNLRFTPVYGLLHFTVNCSGHSCTLSTVPFCPRNRVHVLLWSTLIHSGQLWLTRPTGTTGLLL